MTETAPHQLRRRRRGLAALIERTRPGSLITVVAGAGYGKSTLLAHWQESSLGRAVVIPLDGRHGDPDELGRHIIDRLRRAAPNLASLQDVAAASRPDWAGSVFPMVPVLQGARTVTPMFDDVQVITTPESQALMRCFLSAQLSSGTAVLSGRLVPEFGVDAPITRLTREELRLGPHDVQIAAHGLLPTRTATRLAQATWGWPAGVTVALALLRRGSLQVESLSTASLREGLERYLEEEVIAPLPPDLCEVLMLAAASRSGDVVTLQRLLPGVDVRSALSRLATADVPLVAMAADEPGSLVMHDLIRESLDSRYALRDPEARRSTLLRLAGILAARGEETEAFQMVLRSHHRPALLAFIAEHGFALAMKGRSAPVHHWLSHVTGSELLGNPRLLFVQAVASAVDYDNAGTQHAIGLYLSSVGDKRPDDQVAAEAAALLEITGFKPVGEGTATVASTFDGPFQTLSRLFMAVAVGAAGHFDLMRDQLDAVTDDAAPYPFLALLHAATMAIHAALVDDVERCEHWSQRARAIAVDHQLDQLPLSSIVDVPEAWLCARRGDRERGLAATNAARRKLARASDGMRLAKLCLLGLLARTAYWLEEYTLAEEFAIECGHLYALEPTATAVGENLAGLRREIADHLRQARAGLTEAELTVLRHLTSHLSAADIAGQLGVSTATVRSHARAIHKKLGVSSRSAAVRAAYARGILPAE